MKIRTLVSIMILVLVLLFITGSCATGKKMIPADEAMKRFEGVYVNGEYLGDTPTQPQKFVITADGRIEDWARAANEHPSFRGKYMIAESWTDSRGNLYCKADLNYGTGRTQELWRLDKTGKTLEVNFKYGSGGEYPTKIDPDVEPYGPLYYCIWYRQ